MFLTLSLCLSLCTQQCATSYLPSSCPTSAHSCTITVGSTGPNQPSAIPMESVHSVSSDKPGQSERAHSISYVAPELTMGSVQSVVDTV